MLQLLKKRVSTVMAATLLVGLSSATTDVPLREKGVGTVTSVAPGHIAFAGVGTGTHLGKYTELGSNDFDDQGHIFNGQFLITAADGSTISGTYSGTYTPLSSGKIQFNLSVIYVQGTRRLTGVTGQANVIAVLDDLAPGSAFQYEGFGTLVVP
jgi:hypothetical protein